MIDRFVVRARIRYGEEIRGVKATPERLAVLPDLPLRCGAPRGMELQDRSAGACRPGPGDPSPARIPRPTRLRGNDGPADAAAPEGSEEAV